MIKSYYKTKLLTDNFLTLDNSQFKNDTFKVIGYKNIEKIINPLWLEYAKNLELNFKGPMVFYRAPYMNTGKAHIDLAPDRLTIVPGGFNFVIGGQDSSMVWYERPDENITVQFTMTGSPFCEWAQSSLKEIDRYTIKENEIVLVRTDVPHTIEMKSCARTCVSLRLEFQEKFIWETLVKFVADKGLLEDE